MRAEASEAASPRWELYRLLGEPMRLRLLALVSAEELSIGELAELVKEAQPNVSKHAAPLRRAGLVTMRKQGTRVFVRVADAALSDPLVADAIHAGRELAEEDGSLARVADVVRARDAATREFFSKARGGAVDAAALPSELPAYLGALASLISHRALAVDVGTGDGSLLDVLAPVFERVIAIDREDAQLARARERLARRGYANVELVRGELDDAGVLARVTKLGGADVVFASRILHHAPRPAQAMKRIAALARAGGAVVVIDYIAHEDERMREHQADLWLGFAPDELSKLAHGAGLTEARVTRIPRERYGQGPDGHLDWQLMVAHKKAQSHTESTKTKTH